MRSSLLNRSLARSKSIGVRHAMYDARWRYPIWLLNEEGVFVGPGEDAAR